MRSANRLCAHVVRITSIPTWRVGDGDGVGRGGGSEVKKNTGIHKYTTHTTQNAFWIHCTFVRPLHISGAEPGGGGGGGLRGLQPPVS